MTLPSEPGVGGQLLIDNWSRHETTEDQGTVVLQAGRAYSVRLEVYEHTGVATARLLGSSPRRSKQVIPADRLRPLPPASPP